MTNRRVDAAIARLSRTQHGAWSRRQALDAGASSSLIGRRLDARRWVRLDAGVYGDPAVPPGWHRSIMVAVLAEAWAVASHRTAGVLHGLDGFRPGRPEITVPAGAHARGRTARVHRGVDVRTTVVGAIPCVTLGQAFVDLAQVVSESKLHTALARRHDATPQVLDEVRDRYCALAPRGGRDLRNLRTALDRFGAGKLPSTTALERSLHRLVRELDDVPPVQWEAPFPGRDPGHRRVDGLIEDWHLVLEGDGRAWHTRLEDFERDRRRDAEAAAAGYQTLRFTWHELTAERPWCGDILLATGAARSGTALGGSTTRNPTVPAPESQSGAHGPGTRAALPPTLAG